MGTREQDVRDQLLARAAAVARRTRSAAGLPPDRAEVLLRVYYRHVAVDDLLQRDPVDLYGAALSHLRLAESRTPGTAAVQVGAPTVEEHGWSCRHTVVEVVTDDMPFLVDSVTMELSRQNRALHLVVHPQLEVRRDADGRIAVLGEAPGERGQQPAGEARCRESWIHVEIDRESEPDDLRAIESGLRRVLADVRSAVDDWQPMRAKALQIAAELAEHPPAGQAASDVAETRELLRWLAGDHFTFVGYREYALPGAADEPDPDPGPADPDRAAPVPRAVPDSGLGVLRDDGRHSQDSAQLPPAMRALALERRLLVLTKADSRSTVHRPAYLDYVGVRSFGARGEVVGERGFLGLFTSAAYSESVRRVPVLRQKAAEVLHRSGFGPDSHSGKAMLDILEHYPRDELFQVSVEELLDTATAILHLQERRRLRVFARRDGYGRFVSVLVYLPRDHFATAVRLRLQQILLEAYGGSSIDFDLRFSESVLARLHFVVRLPRGATVPDVEVADLERRLAAAIRTWADDFGDALVEEVGEERAVALARRYATAFPASYREDFSARTGVADLRRVESLRPEGDLAVSLYGPGGAAPDERRFKIYRTGPPLSLARVVPLLTQMGVEVVAERPYEVADGDGVRGWIYDFGLRYDGRAPGAPRRLPNGVRELFQDAFAAVWSGECESDGFNALVLRAGLTWQQVAVLRAYAKYLRQAGSTFSQAYIEDALVANGGIARTLVELFQTRLDPRCSLDDHERQVAAKQLTQRVEEALDEVASLDQDRILRSLLRLVTATLRTNYFRTGEGHGPVGAGCLAVKLDARAVPELPKPRPQAEIWVYSPRVEGVHLRFGPVARGGLRWSDRREDFRTEVLGLAKAQMVKNALIVPVGAKGGFFCKRLPDPVADRDAWSAEGAACYETFVAGLLELTDNVVGGRVVPPPDVVRHDGDDPYLVVAADKGTASFSDLANAVARRYGYWLDDAFASGGSTGYDHKALGITARGAWESVRRHLRELGRDPDGDLTCVGIGDMSGDVFGNGMLVSPRLRLLAAFDHRHVFLDPDPDPETAYAERRRLFELPRSSWADYNPELISAGGGVFRRTAKSVPVTDPVRRALGIADGVSTLTPNELVKAILTAPVDLLWNGGIGTFVKASSESHADVGDKAGDAVRVDATQLRCRCVGEGGNLGCTQLARVEYAAAGGRINTDFIDNSAGVDASDHEVNIKILLNGAVADGDLTTKQRNQLLAQTAEEVSALVLRDNRDQNVVLQTEAAVGGSMLHVYADLMRSLERTGTLDRSLYFLPGGKQLRERQRAQLGLTVPELAVLLAATKIMVAEQLLASDLPEDPFLRRDLGAYFPGPLRERFADRMAGHPLRREIATAQVVNRLVTMAGITYCHRLSQETGAAPAEVTRAHLAARAVLGADELWAEVERLDGRLDADTQSRLRSQIRTATERAARWLVQHRRPPLDIGATVARFATDMARLREAAPDLVGDRERALFESERDALAARGVPAELATSVAALAPTYAGFAIAETAQRSGQDLLEVARVHFGLGERLGLGRLLEGILALPRRSRWESAVRAGLRDDLHAVHAALTAAALEGSEDGVPAAERLRRWQPAGGDALLDRTRQLVAETLKTDGGQPVDLARLSVGVRAVRRLLP